MTRTDRLSAPVWDRRADGSARPAAARRTRREAPASGRWRRSSRSRGCRSRSRSRCGPALLAFTYSSAAKSIAGRSAEALAGAGARASSRGRRSSRARAVAGRCCRSRPSEPSPASRACATSCRTPVSSFEPRASAPTCCMLGERSRTMIVVSGRPPAVSPSQPPESGRLTAKIRPAIAAIRNAMISHCRTRA